MQREDVIKKIESCLALSKSSNENEAIDALKTAQRLMAKYNIDLEYVGTTQTENVEREYTYISGNVPWVRNLAFTIASNFRCVHVFVCCGNKRTIAFAGYKSDAVVACLTFKVAYEYSKRKGANLAQLKIDKGLSSKGIPNSYGEGFTDGISEAYKEQVKTNEECAIMVVIPNAVIEYVSELEKIHFKNINSNLDIDAYLNGKEDGKLFGSSKALEEN